MQQIDNALHDLADLEPSDPARYPRNARRIATRILTASEHLGDKGCPAREAAEALSFAIREYVDAIEKLIATDAAKSRKR